MDDPRFEARLIGCSAAFDHGYFDPEDAWLMQEYTDRRNYVALLTSLGEHIETVWEIEGEDYRSIQEREPILEMTESSETFVAPNNSPANCPGRKEPSKRSVEDFFEFEACFACSRSLIFDGSGNRI